MDLSQTDPFIPSITDPEVMSLENWLLHTTISEPSSALHKQRGSEAVPECGNCRFFTHAALRVLL